VKTVAALALIVLVALPGCRRADDQRTETIDAAAVREAREALDPIVVAQLDSGNVAFREQRYPDALAFYREAARRDPDAAAAWFGVYMAELALGNAAAAEEALRRARDVAPRATLVEPGVGDPPFVGPEAPAPAAPAELGVPEDAARPGTTPPDTEQPRPGGQP
jgi:tetratricopeptide (TPR) repeat protein